MEIPANGWTPRPYQHKLWDYFMGGGRHAAAVWHRRAGKDDVALHWTCVAAHRRVATYWHMLPTYNQARKAMWEAINPHTGKRRIDEAFPHELRASTNSTEMRINFKCGSTWQLVGSDTYNALVGAPPAGIVYSEWALADPAAHAYISPILRENNGWALFIYTSRGYNHGFSTFKNAQRDQEAFAELLTVDDTGRIPQEELERDRQEKIDLFGPEAGEALWRQEWYNDWSAANIGAVLGAGVERADKDGRITDFEVNDWPVVISSDIGFHDTASWWFWQPKLGGFDLIDYDQGIGMDADDWIERLKLKPYKVAKIWLPHDARAKTFQSKHSAMERFLTAYGPTVVGVVPQGKVSDRINAGRRVLERCRFHATNCKQGLDGLRAWHFDWDESKLIMSAEPKHDWSSHPGDAFTYGCQILGELVAKQEPEDKPIRGLSVGGNNVTLNEMWRSVRKPGGRI